MALQWSLHATPARLRLGTFMVLAPYHGSYDKSQGLVAPGASLKMPPFSTVEARSLLFSFLRKQFCCSHGWFHCGLYHLLLRSHTSAQWNQSTQWESGCRTGSKSHNLLLIMCNLPWASDQRQAFLAHFSLRFPSKFGTEYQKCRSTAGSHGEGIAALSPSDPQITPTIQIIYLVLQAIQIQ